MTLWHKAIPVLVVLMTSVAARADSFVYSFTDAAFGRTQHFTYVSPQLITAATTVTPLNCMDGAVGCTSVMIDPVNGNIQLNETTGVHLTQTALSPASFQGGFSSAFLSTLAVVDVPTVDKYAYIFRDVTGSGNVVEFTYASPQLITTATTLSPLTCMAGAVGCTSVVIDPVNGNIQLGERNGVHLTQILLDPAYFQPGFKVAFLSSLDVVPVNTVTPVAVTPEPASLTLLATGVLAGLGMFWRSRQRIDKWRPNATTLPSA